MALPRFHCLWRICIGPRHCTYTYNYEVVIYGISIHLHCRSLTSTSPGLIDQCANVWVFGVAFGVFFGAAQVSDFGLLVLLRPPGDARRLRQARDVDAKTTLGRLDLVSGNMRMMQLSFLLCNLYTNKESVKRQHSEKKTTSY